MGEFLPESLIWINRSNDVPVPTKSRERDFDARPGRPSGLQKSELVLVGNYHRASLEWSASRHGSTSFMPEGLQVRVAVTHQANYDELVRGVGYFFGAV